MVVGLVVYAVIATTIGSSLPSNVLLQTIYYVVAGLIWIWPALWIMAWARRDDLSSGDR